MSELTWTEILERIERGEDEYTEFKRWQGFPKKVSEAICAFANSDGGLLVLGVDDSGKILGVDGDHVLDATHIAIEIVDQAAPQRGGGGGDQDLEAAHARPSRRARPCWTRSCTRSRTRAAIFSRTTGSCAAPSG